MLTFVRNRGELAEGWYDPATLRKAQAASSSANPPSRKEDQRLQLPSSYRDTTRNTGDDASVDSNDEDIGPALPSDMVSRNTSGDPNVSRSGPSIPTLEDLELQKGTSKKPSPKLIAQRATILTHLQNKPPPKPTPPPSPSTTPEKSTTEPKKPS